MEHSGNILEECHKTDKQLLAKHKYIIYKEYNKCIKSHHYFLKPNTHTHTHNQQQKTLELKWKTKTYHTVGAVPKSI
jgi:hypothetical protein